MTGFCRAVQNKMPNYYFATIALHRQTSLDRMIDDAMTTSGSGRGTPTSSSAGCACAPQTLRLVMMASRMRLLMLLL